MKTTMVVGLLLLFVMVLTACGGQPEAETGSGSSGGCAAPAHGAQLLTNDEAGYCLTYPEDFVVEGTALDQSISPAPGREANTPPVAALPWVTITVEETASQSVGDAVAAYMAARDYNVNGEPVTLGGEPALLLDQLPGQELERKIFVVHAGRVYQLTFVPADPAAEQFAPMESLYKMVTDSFVFIAPDTTDVEIPASLDDLVLTMERGPCFGACPVYQVTVYGDGNVEYLGREYVAQKGEREGQLPAEQVRHLVEEIYRAGFWEMQDRYDGDVSDLPATTLTVTLGERYKSVYDYYEPPAALIALEQAVDEISGAANWVGEEGTSHPDSSTVWLLVQAPDQQLNRVDLKGEVTPLGSSEVRLRPAGFGVMPMVDGSVTYAFNAGEGPLLQVMDSAVGDVVAQTFIKPPASTLAVNPSNESASDTGRPPLRLAWGEIDPEGPTARLYLSALDGSDQQVVQEKSFAEGEAPFSFVPLQWSVDGTRLIYTTEPYGLGGFIPFRAAGDLFVYAVGDDSTEALFETGREGGLCVDAISPDAALVAHHCSGPLTVLNLGTGESTTVTLPENRDDSLFGTVRFSPDQSRVAYALSTGDPNDLQGAVAVTDGLEGASNLILSREGSELIHVVTWLDTETLLLQIEGDTPTIWTVRADSTALTKVADGTLLAYSTTDIP